MYQVTWADKQWIKDKCLGITFKVKYKGKLIVKLKAIKSKKDIFYYLSSYLHYSFF